MSWGEGCKHQNHKVPFQRPKHYCKLRYIVHPKFPYKWRRQLFLSNIWFDDFLTKHHLQILTELNLKWGLRRKYRFQITSKIFSCELKSHLIVNLHRTYNKTQHISTCQTFFRISNNLELCRCLEWNFLQLLFATNFNSSWVLQAALLIKRSIAYY